jgi:glutamate formiminotransferase
MGSRSSAHQITSTLESTIASAQSIVAFQLACGATIPINTVTLGFDRLSTKEVIRAVLECVINISEGTDAAVLRSLQSACAVALLDVHTDAHHNRSVFTLGGAHVESAARDLTEAAVHRLDIRAHTGVHPRIGVVDVVPFVPLPGTNSEPGDAARAQVAFAQWVSAELHVPAFLYGANRSLPELRKGAFIEFPPEFGPPTPHTGAGAVAVGQRPVLIAYNLWLDTNDIRLAREIAGRIRRPGLRTLGLDVGGQAQVSCNIVDTDVMTPEIAYDLVSSHAPVDRAELVGLLPREVLLRLPRSRWTQLDIDEDRTIEARLSSRRRETGSD